MSPSRHESQLPVAQRIKVRLSAGRSLVAITIVTVPAIAVAIAVTVATAPTVLVV